MRKRKVADSSESWRNLFITLILCIPSDIVMRQHSPFWHSSSSTCINKSTALPWSYLYFSLFNLSIFYLTSQLDKIFPCDKFSPKIIFLNFIIIKNYSFDFSFFKYLEKFRSKFPILSNNNFGP